MWDQNLDKKALQEFKSAIDCDDIKIKEKIKEILLNNRFIVHVLNNKELEESEAEPVEYYGENILPYYIIPDAQSASKNYLCFEVSYDSGNRFYGSSIHNNAMKVLQITFYILCYHKDIMDEDTDVARHDLLAALVQDEFNFSTEFGSRIMLVSDEPSTTDSLYATRTLIFQQITDNNLVKSNLRNLDGIPKSTPRLANKDRFDGEGSH